MIWIWFFGVIFGLSISVPVLYLVMNPEPGKPLNGRLLLFMEVAALLSYILSWIYSLQLLEVVSLIVLLSPGWGMFLLVALMLLLMAADDSDELYD